MPPEHPIGEKDTPEPGRPAVLGLLREDVRTRRGRRDEPGVIGVDAESECVPGDAFGRDEFENGGSYRDAERTPGEEGAQRELG